MAVLPQLLRCADPVGTLVLSGACRLPSSPHHTGTLELHQHVWDMYPSCPLGCRNAGKTTYLGSHDARPACHQWDLSTVITQVERSRSRITGSTASTIIALVNVRTSALLFMPWPKLAPTLAGAGWLLEYLASEVDSTSYPGDVTVETGDGVAVEGSELCEGRAGYCASRGSGAGGTGSPARISAAEKH